MLKCLIFSLSIKTQLNSYIILFEFKRNIFAFRENSKSFSKVLILFSVRFVLKNRIFFFQLSENKKFRFKTKRNFQWTFLGTCLYIDKSYATTIDLFFLPYHPWNVWLLPWGTCVLSHLPSYKVCEGLL